MLTTTNQLHKLNLIKLASITNLINLKYNLGGSLIPSLDLKNEIQQKASVLYTCGTYKEYYVVYKRLTVNNKITSYFAKLTVNDNPLIPFKINLGNVV